jgi:RHS repeat-associated protein
MTYDYDPFGNVTAKTGTLQNSYLYAGYQFDDETGLYYLNARYYDPVNSRMLSADTYPGDIKDPLSLNLYTYCKNEPMMYSDPTGYISIPVDPRYCAAMAMQQQQYYYAYAAIMESQRAGLLSQEQTGTLAAKAVTEAAANGYDPTTVTQLTVNDKDGHILSNFTAAVDVAKNPSQMYGKDTSDISGNDEITGLMHKGTSGDYYNEYQKKFNDNLFSGAQVAMYGVYPDDEYYKAVSSGLIDPAKISLEKFINTMAPVWEYTANHRTWKDDIRDCGIILLALAGVVAGELIGIGVQYLVEQKIGLLAEELSQFSRAELKIIKEAKSILNSTDFAKI